MLSSLFICFEYRDICKDDEASFQSILRFPFLGIVPTGCFIWLIRAGTNMILGYDFE